MLMLKVRKFQKYMETSDVVKIYISRFLLKNAKRLDWFSFDRIRISGIRRLKLRALLQQYKHVDALRRRFSDVLINISAAKMRMDEMSSSEFSESADTLNS